MPPVIRVNAGPDPSGAISMQQATLLELARISYYLQLLCQSAGLLEEPQLPDMTAYLVANQ